MTIETPTSERSVALPTRDAERLTERRVEPTVSERIEANAADRQPMHCQVRLAVSATNNQPLSINRRINQSCCGL